MCAPRERPISTPLFLLHLFSFSLRVRANELDSDTTKYRVQYVYKTITIPFLISMYSSVCMLLDCEVFISAVKLL